ncbi:hypothetical protein ABIE44_002704 [Marmoricola sp. OAE513]
MTTNANHPAAEPTPSEEEAQEENAETSLDQPSEGSS